MRLKDEIEGWNCSMEFLRMGDLMMGLKDEIEG